jgi:hypothetical protein
LTKYFNHIILISSLKPKGDYLVMTTKVTPKVALAHGSGIDLKKSHRGNPSLDSVKRAASSQITNMDQRRVSPTKIEKKITHTTRDSDNEQYLDASSDTDSNDDSCAHRAAECFKTAAEQPVGVGNHRLCPNKY